MLGREHACELVCASAAHLTLLFAACLGWQLPEVALLRRLWRLHRAVWAMAAASHLTSPHTKSHCTCAQLEGCLQSGFHTLNWNSLGILEFIQACQKAITNFQQVVKQVQKNSGIIEQVGCPDALGPDIRFVCVSAAVALSSWLLVGCPKQPQGPPQMERSPSAGGAPTPRMRRVQVEVQACQTHVPPTCYLLAPLAAGGVRYHGHQHRDGATGQRRCDGPAGVWDLPARTIPSSTGMEEGVAGLAVGLEDAGVEEGEEWRPWWWGRWWRGRGGPLTLASLAAAWMKVSAQGPAGPGGAPRTL